MLRLQIRDVTLEVAALEDAVDRGAARVLREIGAATQRDAQQSIRPGQGSAPPGSPPHDSTGVLRASIRYAVDAEHRVLVVGPEHQTRKSRHAPRALEYGGFAVSHSGDALNIAARPYMRPAFGRTLQRHLPRLLADSIQ